MSQNPSAVTVEIACNNYTACVNAYKAGANRIELFENLHEGGCTPSFGLLKKVKETIPIPVYVMIRPRGGHFVYTQDEIDIMRSDINTCRVLAADGIVLGALTAQGNIDEELCKRLLSYWKNQPATFHRAFDRSINLNESAEKIINLGFERILTSGGCKTAIEGKEVIKNLQLQYGAKIKIMPGSGITPQNAKEIISTCGVTEIHATCKNEFIETNVQYNTIFNDSYPTSDEEIIRELATSLK